MSDTIEIVLAILGSSAVGSIVSGVVSLISKHIEKKNGTAQRLEQIEKKLDEHIAQSYRNKILAFQNELFLKRRHTIEEWNEVIEALEKYSKHCKINSVDNEKIQLAEEYIKTVYKQCQLKADFEPMTRPMISKDEMHQIIAEAKPNETN